MILHVVAQTTIAKLADTRHSYYDYYFLLIYEHLVNMRTLWLKDFSTQIDAMPFDLNGRRKKKKKITMMNMKDFFENIS